MSIFVPLFLIYLFHPSQALIGYDCGSSHLNITTVSLLEIGECDIPVRDIKEETIEIQLLQAVEYQETPVIQCKLEFHRTVYKCGIFGHLLPVENAVKEYIYEISSDACAQLHATGIFKYGDKHVITGITVNRTQTFSIDFAGNAKDDKCNGGSYSDYYGTWNDVFVQGTMKVTLFAYRAQTKLATDKVHLRSGTVCRLSDTNCIDSDGGHFGQVCQKTVVNIISTMSFMKVEPPR